MTRKRSFTLAAFAMTAAAEAMQYGAPVDPAWAAAMAPRDDCAKALAMCTDPVMMHGTATTLTYLCSKTSKAQTTTHVTVTRTTTVTASPSNGSSPPPKDAPAPADGTTTTTTIHATSTQYKTVTMTRKKASTSPTPMASQTKSMNSTVTSSVYLPKTMASGSSGVSAFPVSRNATSAIYSMPTVHNNQETAKPSYTGTAYTGSAGRESVSIAALFFGLMATVYLT